MINSIPLTIRKEEMDEKLVASRKLNKIDKSREDFIQWILDCTIKS